MTTTREKNLKEWAKCIGALIEQFGSYEAAAVAIGVSYPTIIRWKHGKSMPHRIARARIEELERRKIR